MQHCEQAGHHGMAVSHIHFRAVRAWFSSRLTETFSEAGGPRSNADAHCSLHGAAELAIPGLRCALQLYTPHFPN